MIRTYEIAFWLTKDSAEKSAEEPLDFLARAIGELDGEVLKTTKPFKKRLAYPLKNQTESYFGTMFVKLSPEAAKAIPENLKHQNEILRLAVFEAKKEKTSRATQRISARRKKFLEAGEEKKSEPALEELDKKLEEILKT